MAWLEVTFSSPGQAGNLLPGLRNLDSRGILPSTSTEEALLLREDSGNLEEALSVYLTYPSPPRKHLVEACGEKLECEAGIPFVPASPNTASKEFS